MHTDTHYGNGTGQSVDACLSPAVARTMRRKFRATAKVLRWLDKGNNCVEEDRIWECLWGIVGLAQRASEQNRDVECILRESALLAAAQDLPTFDGSLSTAMYEAIRRAMYTTEVFGDQALIGLALYRLRYLGHNPFHAEERVWCRSRRAASESRAASFSANAALPGRTAYPR